MADPNTRTGKRTPVTLKIKFKSETLEQFIERYAVDVSQGGIFIRTKEPLPVGTQMRFEFQLRDATPLIGGEGTVVWTRENDPSRPAIAPGMGVRFDRLAEGSQSVLERILAEKAKQAPNRPASDSIRPPLFTDTPTRVAPAPIQEQLLGVQKQLRRNEEEQQTPLPKPMPFHSDADEFPDEAFEEATKVRALDDLAAQMADSTEAASGARAAEPPATAAGSVRPQPGEDSAPNLPTPPEPGEPAARPRLLDTTPSPRTETPPPTPAEPSAAKTKLGLGLEAPRMHSPSAAPLSGSPGPGPSVGGPMSQAGSSPARALPTESTSPTRKPDKRSSAPMAILIVLLLAAAAGAVWFFVIRNKGTSGTTTGSSGSQVASGSAATPGSGSAVAPVGSGSEPAGSGSAMAATGSGSATPETPKAPAVDTVIEANVPKARVEVTGTPQSGETPFTAKLEKDKPYKVLVSAPGYVPLEVDLVGGAPKHTAALVAKPRIISFKTDPAGALVSIDGFVSGKTTPLEVELTKAQAAKKILRIRIAKAGFKPIDKTIDTDKYTEDDARMIATIDEKLQVQAVRPPGGGSGGTGGTGGTGSATPTGTGGTGDGSAAPTGGGSAAPPPPPPPPPGDGSAAGATR